MANCFIINASLRPSKQHSLLTHRDLPTTRNLGTPKPRSIISAFSLTSFIHCVSTMSVTSTSSYGPVTVSGTVTEYLPLTTAWPFSAGCSTQILSNGFSSISAPSSIYFNDPKYANVVPGQPTCLPPEVSYWWYQDKKASTTTLLGGYSFLCPEAYSTAYSTVGTTSNSVTTTIGCCPT